MWFTEPNDCPIGACNGGGECIDGDGMFVCNCHAGYTGQHCETGKHL